MIDIERKVSGLLEYFNKIKTEDSGIISTKVMELIRASEESLRLLVARVEREDVIKFSCVSGRSKELLTRIIDREPHQRVLSGNPDYQGF